MMRIIKNIHDDIENIKIEQQPRSYIGYSSIGSKCKRALWYGYRQVKRIEIPLRVHRLFERGIYEEKIIINDLKRIGIDVSYKQLKVVNKERPVLRGHIDGIVHIDGSADEDDMLLEMKTANHSNFEKIKKNGIKAYSPAYWIQMNGYMSELELSRCLYVITNKNNEERMYLIYELDNSCLTDIKYIVDDILDNDTIPKKIGSNIWYECKFCNYYDICHKEMEINMHCFNCIFVVSKYYDKDTQPFDCNHPGKTSHVSIIENHRCEYYEKQIPLQNS